ncbi:ribosome-associated translation inhibitor RaiA [Alloprevotella sp. OH1205_COT-284]|uniref:HPF/RaiA family ribosome-associated protein n=1 Tax=Alloprevotella sp. OH1205_COT-284 TaxID=2491043 RepID=UPI000F5D739D|nr:HPF/RaiA family ribosome-associated protein [Alloprevotella sp. OH1205_COT-284]RRD80133.1 ribosome-associated translation inhibitor RaiA [Alloprevotella sp. OH1205_COT-284]
MNFKLQTIHFNAAEKLVAYIDKKMSKLEKHDNILNVELTLKVVKPETANNKEANLHVSLPGRKIHAEKVADTFEEAIDLCVDVVRRELTQNSDSKTKSKTPVDFSM